MGSVIQDAKQGRYDIWEQVLPVIGKLKMDMAIIWNMVFQAQADNFRLYRRAAFSIEPLTYYV